MRRATIEVLACVGLAAGPVHGQFVVGPVGYTSAGYQSGFGFGFGGRGFAFGGGFRSTYSSSFSTFGPLVGPAGFVGGPVVVMPPPVVVVQNPTPVVIQAVFPPSADAAELARQPAPVPAPRANRADFVAVRPQAGAKPAPVVRGNLFAPEARPAVRPDPGDVPRDPKQAAVFHVMGARAAFAVGEFGRAAEQLAEAVAADPTFPLPHFLLAQVRTARGEYAEAVVALRDGMKLAPDWPASGFRIRELYGKNQPLFDEHLGDLRRANAAHPDDPALMVLLGYHLWFLGEKADAGKLFRKAAGRVRGNGVIDRFLEAAEGKDV